MNVKLSIIVPVYNTAPWLGRCLDSICAQSYKNLEILCVNDGSTDNSADILAEYAAKDARIKVFHQKNAGLSAARNTGLQHATGEWVTGVDSDDYLYPDIYCQAVEYCREGVDIVFFGMKPVDEQGKELPQNLYFNLPSAGEYVLTPKLAASLNVCFVSKLWRRSLIEEQSLIFPVGMVHEDDALYWTAAPYVNKIAICPKIGYAYMRRLNSITNQSGLDTHKRIKRYVPAMEFVHAEYQKRGMLHTKNRAYLVAMFVTYCNLKYFIPEGKERCEVIQTLRNVIQRCSLTHDSYALERFVPYERKGRLEIIRRARVKIYRFCRIPIWCSFYTNRGVKVTPAVLLSHFWKKVKGKN